MIAFPNIKDCEAFPLPESSTLEFKRSFNSCPREKIMETVCAFLNGDGGHIVFGVEDETRAIIGIKVDKSMDTFQLMLDNNIYHEGRIKNQNGNPIHLGAVKSETTQAANSNKVFVITVTPEIGETYCLRDGTIWRRLSASNYKQTIAQKLYTEQELEVILARRLADQKGALRLKHQSEYDKLKSKFQDLEGDFTKVVSASKSTEQHLNEFRDLLHASIQRQKEAVETELVLKNKCRFFCCI